MDSVSKVSNFIEENASSIAAEIVEYNIQKLEFKVPEARKKAVLHFQTEFVKLLGEVILYADDHQVEERFHEWYGKYEQNQKPNAGIKVSSIVAPYADVRLLFNKRMAAISQEHKLSIGEASMIQNRLNYMLDMGIVRSIISYEEFTESENKKHRDELIELSSPIVPIQDGIAVLPLIGSMDHERVEHMMNHTVPKVSRLQIRSLIIDFSGIVKIDTEVAHYIFNIYHVLQLLGIEVIFTGIRPDLAVKAVNSGIDFTVAKNYSNVKKAIEDMEE